MKYILLLIVSLCIATASLAQNKIKALQYWFNDNYAARVDSTFTATTSLVLNTSVSTANLNNGLHVVNIRFLDDSNFYSVVHSSFFIKYSNGSGLQLKHISAYEYWYDNDFGNKISVQITPTTTFYLDSLLSTSTCDQGLHVLNIRFQQNDGHYSEVLSHFFYKAMQGSQTQNNIVGYEYWFDNDYSAKVTDTLPNTTTVNHLSNINCNSINNGLHVLNMRYKDEKGTWSPVLSAFFEKKGSSISNVQQISAYEYWFDNDYGNKQSDTVSASAGFHLNQNIFTSNLASGLHQFHIRFLDGMQQWSQVLSAFFSKNTSAFANGANKIVGYRYWYNNQTDSAFYVPVSTSTETLQLNLLLNLFVLQKGYNSIQFQFKDSLQNWSIVQSDSFFRTPVPQVSFYCPKTKFCDGDTVKFINTSKDMDVFSWNFGDGDSSNAFEPMHIFANSGLFSPQLLATDNLSGQSKDTLRSNYLLVNALPSVSASTNSNLYSYDTLQLIGNSLPNATSSWNGPGSYSSAAAQNVIYPAKAILHNGTYTYSITDSNNCKNEMTLPISITASAILQAKAILGGAYNSSNGLMNDQLRSAGLLPLTEPYSNYSASPSNTFNQVGGGNETSSNMVFSVSGNNAIVDWVFVQLRNENNINDILATRSALIQRDGDIVDVDGYSPIRFKNAAPGNYFITIKHRNHFGLETAQAIALGEDPVTVDFSDSSLQMYTAPGATHKPYKLIGMKATMWTGDINHNKQIKYNGIGNDRLLVLSKLGTNGATGVLNGVYIAEDVNLDATLKYNGVSNDRLLLLQQIGSATGILTECTH